MNCQTLKIPQYVDYDLQPIVREIPFYIKDISDFLSKLHCVKSIRIRSFSGSYFLAFGLNTERNGVSLRIQPECAKVRVRKTPNTDSFYAVLKSIKEVPENLYLVKLDVKLLCTSI